MSSVRGIGKRISSGSAELELLGEWWGHSAVAKFTILIHWIRSVSGTAHTCIDDWRERERDRRLQLWEHSQMLQHSRCNKLNVAVPSDILFGFSLSKTKLCTSLHAGNGLGLDEWCRSWHAFHFNTVILSALVSLCLKLFGSWAAYILGCHAAPQYVHANPPNHH